MEEKQNPVLAFFICVLFIGPLCAAKERPNSQADSSRPNFIVILADDMGYSDLGCTGSEIETPNLDQMASDGLLFTHCYNTSRCCPTRAALLTGQYQWDAGIGHMTSVKSELPEYSDQLNKNCATIAELLGQNGYSTFMAGKWHLGDQRESWPDRRGFNQFYGTPQGGGIYFYPSKFYDRPVFQNNKEIRPKEDWYSTDAFTDATIDFIKNKRDEKRPFFVYLAYIAPHFPLQAKSTDIDKYEKTYSVGYEEIRRARFQRQRKKGIVPEDNPLPPAAFEWSAVKDKEKEARKMAVYAAQVDCMDQNVGKLMAALKDEGIQDNTLVLFLSDNGGAKRSFNKTPNAVIGSRNSNASYGKWHNVSNTPYRKGKAQEHEGGIISPMIVHWPNGIQKPNRMIHQPVHVMDVMPSFLEISRTEYPAEFAGHRLDPLDGSEFASTIQGELKDFDRVLYWEHEGNRAVRRGDWKLVSLHNKNWELYDLSTDPFETRNLAKKHSQRVAALKGLYETWAEKHGVQPWPLKKKRAK